MKSPRIRLLAEDGQERKCFQPGESLKIAAHGLKPITPHRVTFSDRARLLLTVTLIADRAGVIPPTVVWPLIGLDDPSRSDAVTVNEAIERWGGRRIQLALTRGRTALARTFFTIDRTLSRPLIVATDADGYVRPGFEVGQHDARVALHEFPRWETARIWMVPRQHRWHFGDRIRPVSLADRRVAAVDVHLATPGPHEAVLADAHALEPGAYDFIVRHLRYGYEDDDEFELRATDIVGGRDTTGLVVREPFMASKIIRGGCTNLQRIAGRSLGTWPYMDFVNVFQVGEDVYGALDPSALDPAHVGKMAAIYVVPHKTSAQWSADPSLAHLSILGGNAGAQRLLTQSWCTNANLRLLWPAASIQGEYDVVVDFGNDTADASLFTPDHQFDMPLDIIDGYVAAGFRIVGDPTTDTSFPYAGTFTYDESTEGTIDVSGDGGGWTTPVRAVVFFPADLAGGTTVADVSTERPNYPLVVVVHGNANVDTSYVGYNYLLEHFARNGFVCASVYCQNGMESVPRARVLQHHLGLLFSRFGARLANNVGLMGHSRGGEAVVSAAIRNHTESWGYAINAVVSLAPTASYFTPPMSGPWAPSFLVLYGSLDGDLAGPAETGFDLYDRAGGTVKSMGYVHGACHNRFNTEWGDGDLMRPSIGPLDLPRVISPAAHQAVATGYMTAFFRQHLRGEAEWNGIFTGEWIPAAIKTMAPGIRVLMQYEHPSPRTVDDFEGPHSALSWASSTIGGSVSATGLPVVPREDRLRTIDGQSPHVSGGLQFRWNNLTDALEWSVPAGQRNVLGFAALSFRIGQVVGSTSNPFDQTQDLRVTLTDGSGFARAIRVSKIADVPAPYNRQVVAHRASAMRTIRIPLSAYTVRCVGVSEVDLADVVSVTFEFQEKPTGELAIDSLQFTV